MGEIIDYISAVASVDSLGMSSEQRACKRAPAVSVPIKMLYSTNWYTVFGLGRFFFLESNEAF